MPQTGSEHMPETKALTGVYMICVAAQRFFQQAAQQVTDGNLRYKFIELSALHGNAAQHLPVASTDIVPPQPVSSELEAVQFWYLHQRVALHSEPPPQSMLNELGGLLPRQLSALKQLTQRVENHNAKVTLAHLSAALQMANDQLLPLLKVLPVNEQKIQTIN
jgi:hypothetical protein